jgi:hypothetical protein
MNDARFGSRMRGEGPYAHAIRHLFETTARRLGLGSRPRGDRIEASRRPGQLSLFDDPNASRCRD